jgi:hypothetical protein
LIYKTEPCYRSRLIVALNNSKYEVTISPAYDSPIIFGLFELQLYVQATLTPGLSVD